MSALRMPGPDGRTRLVVIDDGAVGRVTHSRYGINGGVPAVYGSLAVGKSRAEGQRESQRRLRERRETT